MFNRKKNKILLWFKNKNQLLHYSNKIKSLPIPTIILSKQDFKIQQVNQSFSSIFSNNKIGKIYNNYHFINKTLYDLFDNVMIDDNCVWATLTMNKNIYKILLQDLNKDMYIATFSDITTIKSKNNILQYLTIYGLQLCQKPLKDFDILISQLLENVISNYNIDDMILFQNDDNILYKLTKTKNKIQLFSNIKSKIQLSKNHISKLQNGEYIVDNYNHSIIDNKSKFQVGTIIILPILNPKKKLWGGIILETNQYTEWHYNDIYILQLVTTMLSHVIDRQEMLKQIDITLKQFNELQIIVKALIEKIKNAVIISKNNYVIHINQKARNLLNYSENLCNDYQNPNTIESLLNLSEQNANIMENSIITGNLEHYEFNTALYIPELKLLNVTVDNIKINGHYVQILQLIDKTKSNYIHDHIIPQMQNLFALNGKSILNKNIVQSE